MDKNCWQCLTYTKFQNQNECSFIAEEKFIACQRKNSQQSFSIYQIILFRQSFVLLNRVYRIDQKYSFEHRYNSEFQNLKLHLIVSPGKPILFRIQLSLRRLCSWFRGQFRGRLHINACLKSYDKNVDLVFKSHSNKSDRKCFLMGLAQTKFFITSNEIIVLGLHLSQRKRIRLQCQIYSSNYDQGEKISICFRGIREFVHLTLNLKLTYSDTVVHDLSTLFINTGKSWFINLFRLSFMVNHTKCYK